MSNAILNTTLKLVQPIFIDTKDDMSQGSSAERSLLTYVRLVIRENAQYKHGSYSLDIDDLDDMSRENFAAHMIALDAESQDEWAWVMEIEDGSIYKSLIKFMMSGDKLDIYDFAQTMSKYAIAYYSDRMNYLIQQNIASVFHEDMQEAGLQWTNHKDNGECYYASI